MRVLTDPLTPPAVLVKTSMFVLNRPEFPEQGWARPVPFLEPAELLDGNPLIAEDYQRLRDQDAQAYSLTQPDEIRQNSTQFDTSSAVVEEELCLPGPRNRR